MIGNIFQSHCSCYRQFLLGYYCIGDICILLIGLFYKIVAYIEEEWLIKCHTGQLVIDSAGSRQKTHRCDTKCCKQRNHSRHICTRYDQHQNITQKSCNTYCLYQKLGSVIKKAESLHGFYIAFSHLTIFIDKILFLTGNLNILDTLDGFCNPCKHGCTIILILFTCTVHDRLDDILDHYQRHYKQHGYDNCHNRILHGKCHHQKQRYDRFRSNLQYRLNQCIHVTDIRCNASLNN